MRRIIRTGAWLIMAFLLAMLFTGAFEILEVGHP